MKPANTPSERQLRRHAAKALRQFNVSISQLEHACRRTFDGRTCRKIAQWLNKPNPRFGGWTPAQIARKGGQGRVRYELEILVTGLDRIVEKALRPILLAESNSSRFVAQCRQYRRRAGMTVRELAAKTDVPANTIRRIEKGDIRWVRVGQIGDLAYALNWRPPSQPQRTPLAPAKAEAGQEAHRKDH